jgi:hypothetical protein
MHVVSLPAVHGDKGLLQEVPSHATVQSPGHLPPPHKQDSLLSHSGRHMHTLLPMHTRAPARWQLQSSSL